MISRVFPILFALWCWLLVAPASAGDASTETVTGLTNVGPALFVIAIAGAMLLTLFFRASATRVANFVTAKIGNHLHSNQALQRRRLRRAG
jgi:hypothetical protein